MDAPNGSWRVRAHRRRAKRPLRNPFWERIRVSDPEKRETARSGFFIFTSVCFHVFHLPAGVRIGSGQIFPIKI